MGAGAAESPMDVEEAALGRPSRGSWPRLAHEATGGSWVVKGTEGADSSIGWGAFHHLDRRTVGSFGERGLDSRVLDDVIFGNSRVAKF